MTFLIEIMIKSSLLMAGAAAVNLCMRQRGSAATRHLVWTLTMAGLLLLPVFLVAMPSWHVHVPIPQQRMFPGGSLANDTTELNAAVRPVLQEDPREIAPARPVVVSGPHATAARSVDNEGLPSRSGVTWLVVLIGVYVAGVAALLIRLVAQLLSVGRLVRASDELHHAKWIELWRDCARRMNVEQSVRLLRSREQTIPMAVGLRTPAVVLPSVSETWDAERRRAVLLHELAHVARHDCVTQILAATVCALYWFHPGAWWIARRMRDEREIACDDRVVNAGTLATDYASHLLELAYASIGGRAPALAVSMARPNEIETRLRALLDGARNRTMPALRTRIAIATAALAGLAVLAAARATSVPLSAQTSTSRAGSASAPVDRVPQSGTEPRIDPAARAVAEGQPGTWEIRSSGNGMVDVRLSERRGSSHSFVTDTKNVDGATLSLATGSTVVTWRLHQDAGSFALEGIVRLGNAGAFVGAGTFTFEPSQPFPSELVKRGFAQPTRVEQYLLARSSVGYAFIDELAAQGYARPYLTQLVRAAEHGVSLQHVREMGQLGYRLGRIDSLITQVDHGVSPEFVRDLRGQGLSNLTADDLVRARDHGIVPQYVRSLKSFGYAPLTLDALVRARDHGIDADYVRDLRQHGYQLPLEDLIRARDHGVDAEYIKTLADLGYARLSIESLVGARDHGVDPNYVRDLRQLGYQASLRDLINARDHGVDPQYVRELVALGYKDLPLQQLIRLRDHGVDSTYIRELKTLGYSNQTPDDLVRLRDSGLTRRRTKVELRYQFERVLAMINDWMNQL